MAITKMELLNLLKDVADDTDVTEKLKGIEGVSEKVEVPFNAENLTVDDYKKILETNKEVQGYNQSQIDSFVSKGVETFKQGKMQDYIKEAVKKATIPPEETPEQKEIRELKEKFAQMENEKAETEKKLAREQLVKDARGYAEEKKYPTELLDFFVGADLDSSKANLDKMNEVINGIVKNAINKDVQNNSYEPGGGGTVDPVQAQVNQILGI